jgi:hypothetical protein
LPRSPRLKCPDVVGVNPKGARFVPSVVKIVDAKSDCHDDLLVWVNGSAQ